MTAAYDSFLADQGRSEVYAVKLEPWDKDAEAVTSLYYSTHQYATAPGDTPANQLFKAQLVAPPQFTFEAIAPGALGFVGGLSGGELRLGQRMGDLDSLASYAWDGRRCTVYHGGYSPRLGQWLDFADWATSVHEMLTIEVDPLEVSIVLRPKARNFAAKIAKARYRGMPWALNFNGTTNYVSFGAAGTPTAVNLRNDMTFSAWVWIDAADLGSASGLVGWNNSATTSPFSITKTAADKLRFVDSAPTIDQTGSLTFTGDRWWHIAVTISGTTMKFIYYDAQTGTKTVETYTVSAATRPAPDGFFYVGRAVSNYLAGAMHEVRLWNAGLSEGSLDNLRFQPLAAADITSNLKMYLKMNDGTGTTVVDSASGGTNGTVNGTATWYRSLEGDEDLTGEVKPTCYGRVFFVPGRLVHSADRTYQLHDDTTKVATITAYEGGVAITAGTTYTSWKTWAAAATTAGQVDFLRTPNGTYARLGSNPTKPVTFSLEGDASGSGYVSTAGTIVRRIVTTRPPNPLVDPTDLDTASFTALETATTAEVGIWIGEERSIADCLDELLRSVGAIAWFDLPGLFNVRRFEGVSGSPVLSVDERHIVSVDADVSGIPTWIEKLGFKRIYTPHTDDQLAAGAIGTATQTTLARPIRYTSRRDQATFTAHPRAGTAVADTLLTVRDDVDAEALRRLAIFSSSAGELRGFALTLTGIGAPLSFLDVLTLSYSDFDALNQRQERFGFTGGKGVVALGVQQNGRTYTVRVWFNNG